MNLWRGWQEAGHKGWALRYVEIMDAVGNHWVYDLNEKKVQLGWRNHETDDPSWVFTPHSHIKLGDRPATFNKAVKNKGKPVDKQAREIPEYSVAIETYGNKKTAIKTLNDYAIIDLTESSSATTKTATFTFEELKEIEFTSTVMDSTQTSFENALRLFYESGTKTKWGWQSANGPSTELEVDHRYGFSNEATAKGEWLNAITEVKSNSLAEKRSFEDSFETPIQSGSYAVVKCGQNVTYSYGFFRDSLDEIIGYRSPYAASISSGCSPQTVLDFYSERPRTLGKNIDEQWISIRDGFSGELTRESIKVCEQNFVTDSNIPALREAERGTGRNIINHLMGVEIEERTDGDNKVVGFTSVYNPDNDKCLIDTDNLTYLHKPTFDSLGEAVLYTRPQRCEPVRSDEGSRFPCHADLKQLWRQNYIVDGYMPEDFGQTNE